MKKRILSIIFALALLIVAVQSSFADSGNYNAGYQTPVKHYFKTDYVLSKGTTWNGIADHSVETIFISSSATPYHKTYLYSDGGTRIGTQILNVYNDETKSFNSATILAAQSYDYVRFWIYNPCYVSGSSTYSKMKTNGTLISW